MNGYFSDSVTSTFWLMLNEPHLYANTPPTLKDEIRAYEAIEAFVADAEEGPRPVIISGGEVLELGPQEGGDEIPF